MVSKSNISKANIYMLVAAYLAALFASLFLFAAPSNAHQGSPLACPVPSHSGTAPDNQASWGCVWGGTVGSKTALVDVADKRHDHSCVYTYVKSTTHGYQNVGITECTTGGRTGLTWYTDSGNITGMRIYRFSPYGNNYNGFYPFY